MLLRDSLPLLNIIIINHAVPLVLYMCITTQHSIDIVTISQACIHAGGNINFSASAVHKLGQYNDPIMDTDVVSRTVVVYGRPRW